MRSDETYFFWWGENVWSQLMFPRPVKRWSLRYEVAEPSWNTERIWNWTIQITNQKIVGKDCNLGCKQIHYRIAILGSFGYKFSNQEQWTWDMKGQNVWNSFLRLFDTYHTYDDIYIYNFKIPPESESPVQPPLVGPGNLWRMVWVPLMGPGSPTCFSGFVWRNP